MGKAVFFNLPGASGHINPTVGLVSELIRQGEQVIYYAGPDSADRLHALGAIPRTYAPHFDYQHSALFATDMIALALKLLELAEKAVAGLKEDLLREQPDYIIYDSCCMWGKYLAQYLKIPAICSITTFVSTPWLTLSDHVIALFLAKILAGNIPSVISVRRRIINMLASLNLPYGGLFHHIFDLAQNEGDLNLVFLPRSYQPFNNRIKQTFRFVGASVPEGRDRNDLDLQKNGRPLIYISLGTVHNMRDTFYRQCLQAFAGSPYLVVMSVGQQTDIAQLGPLPENFIVRNRVAQLEVLKQADLFISHGGMNSINESLYFGVPLLMVPQQDEQLFNARRVARFGAGSYLDAKAITPDELRKQAQRLLADPSFRHHAQELSRDSRAGGGYQAAADHILNFLYGEGVGRALRKIA